MQYVFYCKLIDDIVVATQVLSLYVEIKSPCKAANFTMFAEATSDLTPELASVIKFLVSCCSKVLYSRELFKLE